MKTTEFIKKNKNNKREIARAIFTINKLAKKYRNFEQVLKEYYYMNDETKGGRYYDWTGAAQSNYRRLRLDTIKGWANFFENRKDFLYSLKEKILFEVLGLEPVEIHKTKKNKYLYFEFEGYSFHVPIFKEKILLQYKNLPVKEFEEEFYVSSNKKGKMRYKKALLFLHFLLKSKNANKIDDFSREEEEPLYKIINLVKNLPRFSRKISYYRKKINY